ncbi:MAG: lysylphosphatidylglycerol synthase transmembrane domain-containing protein [Candidatus Marinarcus sp.]|uniref:lysylphosphatidylglycerol synthase transmembrane domain-containing protein n=1 Tax=Candidatus Marinarcus sp. TaxID=3100987 RepID=UPI003AFFF129
MFQYIKYIIGIILFLYLFSLININELLLTFKKITLIELISIIFISFLLLLLQAFRLHMLIYNYVSSYKETIKLSFVSQFFSNFLPGGVAGDFYKINFLRKNKLSVSSGIAKIGIDRFSGLVVLLIFSTFYFLFNSNWFIQNLSIEMNKVYWLLFFAILLPFIFFIFTNNFKDKIFKIYENIKIDLLKIEKTKLYAFVVLNIIVFIVRLLKFQLIFWVLNYDFNFFDLILVAFVSQIAGMLPISIGGLGVVEVSLVFGLSLFNVPEQTAFAFAILNRATIWIVSIVGGIYWFKFKSNIIFTEKNDSIN